MFRDLEEAVQIEAARVLAKYPRLVGERKLRTLADPFVIALARVVRFQIVTDEKPTGSLHRPNIPDVCTYLGCRLACRSSELSGRRIGYWGSGRSLHQKTGVRFRRRAH